MIKYFVTGHTAEGFVNFLSTNLVGINQIIILQHPSNIIKTKVLSGLISLYEKNHEIELIYSPQDKNYIAGFIIRALSVAIVGDELMEKQHTEIKADYLKLSDNISIRASKKQQVIFETELSRLQEAAYAHFKAGLNIHDQLEKVYINEMDFEKADQIAASFIASIFKQKNEEKKQPVVYERIFGTNTPDGFVNHLEALIEPIKKRFFIKGRAGTGKSFFMNNVLQQCKLRGFDVEVYRCSFDPNSIDMLIVRQLDVCLFDSTPPHELFPSRKNDQIIDFYEKTVTPGTDEKFATQIEKLTNAYKQEMAEGKRQMKAMKEVEKQKETMWKEVNEEEIQAVIKNIIKKM